MSSIDYILKTNQLEHNLLNTCKWQLCLSLQSFLPHKKTTTKNHQRMSNSQWFNVK